MHGLGERAMNSILRFVQVFALGTWVGSIIYLSFVVTRGAFGVLQGSTEIISAKLKLARGQAG